MHILPILFQYSHSINFPFFLFSSKNLYIFHLHTFFMISIIKSLKFSTKPHPLLFLSFLMCFISVCYVNIFPVCTNILKFTSQKLFLLICKTVLSILYSFPQNSYFQKESLLAGFPEKKSPTLCLLIHILFHISTERFTHF